jgi:ABC-2 type transport system ATP-binding protein
MSALLESAKLWRSFPGFRLQEIDLRLEAGSILALIGPNGAGKTTFMKLVMGLIPAEGGALSVCGRSHPDGLVEIRNRVGYVPDVPPFLPNRRVEQVAGLASTFFSRWDPARFAELLDLLTIPGSATVKSLSGGRRTLLSMAVALSHQPDILLLDEPFAGLDASGRRQVLRLMNAFVAGGGKAALIATHQTEGLARLADRIAFLHEGRLILDGQTEDLLAAWKWLRYRKGALAATVERSLKCRETGSFGCRGLIPSLSLIHI